MENKELFQITAEGYNCAQVEQYITVLKTEYKKVFEYAKATEANNEKLKRICRSLSDENKALKANSVVPAASNSNSEMAESQVETVIPILPAPANGVFYEKIRSFFDAIITGGKAPVSTEEIIINQAIIDGIIKSAEAGKEITVEIPEV